jgi:hypothetical protein
MAGHGHLAMPVNGRMRLGPQGCGPGGKINDLNR